MLEIKLGQTTKAVKKTRKLMILHHFQEHISRIFSSNSTKQNSIKLINFKRDYNEVKLATQP